MNITTETTAIETQSRGEDVRDAIVSACGKLAAGSGLPDAATTDYVLTVNSSGKWEAKEWT